MERYPNNYHSFDWTCGHCDRRFTIDDGCDCEIECKNEDCEECENENED